MLPKFFFQSHFGSCRYGLLYFFVGLLGFPLATAGRLVVAKGSNAKPQQGGMGGHPPQRMCSSGPERLQHPPRSSREGRREGKKRRKDRKGRRGGTKSRKEQRGKTGKEDSVQHADIPATQGRRIQQIPHTILDYLIMSYRGLLSPMGVAM